MLLNNRDLLFSSVCRTIADKLILHTHTHPQREYIMKNEPFPRVNGVEHGWEFYETNYCCHPTSQFSLFYFFPRPMCCNQTDQKLKQTKFQCVAYRIIFNLQI